MTEIKTVIFDLGGVYFTDGTKQAVEIINKNYNIPEELLVQVFRGQIGTEYRKGIITHSEFWEKAKKLWKVEGVSQDELAQIWLNGYIPMAGTVQIIKRLKEIGYQLLFLSDNVQERVDYLEEKYKFLNNFEDGIFSHVVKVRKPDSEIYKLALKKSSNPAENCVYIDDKLELLTPARKLGMKAIHFTTPEELERDLVALGVHC